MPRLVVNLNDARPVWQLPAWALDELRAALPLDWEMVVVESPADGRGDGGGPSPEAMRAIRGAEVYLGYGLPPALLEASGVDGVSMLRWVHSAAAGVGGSLYPEMRETDIVLTNSAGIHAPPMAETVLAMVLYFARGLDFAVQAQRQHRWGKPAFEAADTPVGEVAGATLGIVGFGGIGREIATRANALGMQVLALKRRSEEAPAGVEFLWGRGGLEELLRRSHFVVLAVPETAETRDLIGAAELSQMRTDAVLINVARGRVLDEDELLARLQAGQLRGAALDVFRREPLPSDSPLWDEPRVLITPHVSATSRAFWRREMDLILDNLHHYLAGQKPLRNVVDKQAGY